MSTRGVIGFRIEGVDYKTYNHSDSYPSWLGVRILQFVKDHLIDVGGIKQISPEVIGVIKTLEHVGMENSPTARQISKLNAHGIANPHASVSSGQDFYSWLRDTQGDLKAIIQSGFWMDYEGQFNDEEWGYVINIDGECLNVTDGADYRKFRFAEIADITDEAFVNALEGVDA